MKSVSIVVAFIALFMSMLMSVFSNVYTRQYSVVGTGETFRAALGFLLAAAFFIGVAVSSIIITILAKHKGG